MISCWLLHFIKYFFLINEYNQDKISYNEFRQMKNEKYYNDTYELKDVISPINYIDIENIDRDILSLRINDIDNLSNRFFELPDHYKLDYVRINPDANDS